VLNLLSIIINISTFLIIIVIFLSLFYCVHKNMPINRLWQLNDSSTSPSRAAKAHLRLSWAGRWSILRPPIPKQWISLFIHIHTRTSSFTDTALWRDFLFLFFALGRQERK